MRIRLKNGSGVTVKAEDRPSGSAGDSASVSAPFFRISVSVVVRGVCLSRRREAPALSYQDKHTPRLQILIYINNSLSANLMCNIIIAGKNGAYAKRLWQSPDVFNGQIGDFRHR